MRSIEFEGQTFEYDETSLKDYAVQKALSLGTEDMPRFFRAIERIFTGKDVEYSEAVGGDITELIKAVFADATAASAEVKN